MHTPSSSYSSSSSSMSLSALLRSLLKLSTSQWSHHYQNMLQMRLSDANDQNDDTKELAGNFILAVQQSSREQLHRIITSLLANVRGSINENIFLKKYFSGSDPPSFRSSRLLCKIRDRKNALEASNCSVCFMRCTIVVSRDRRTMC